MRKSEGKNKSKYFFNQAEPTTAFLDWLRATEDRSQLAFPNPTKVQGDEKMNYEQNNSQQEPQRKNKNRGNFANDPKRAAEAGRKGGMASHGGGRRSNASASASE